MSKHDQWLFRVRHIIESIQRINTYVAGLYMSALGANAPWLNAFIPVGGYLLSTLSLPKIKEIWLKSKRK